MLTQEVVELLIQAGRLVLSAQRDSKLTASQWMALRFLARANRFSRTLSGFADYQATTRGTASQTIKALERAGFLEREKSAHDGRSYILRLTRNGHSVLNEDPMHVLVEAVEQLNERTRLELRDTLRQALGSAARIPNRVPIGSCSECLFFQKPRRRRTRGEDKRGFCKLLARPVENKETDLLCVKFQPATSQAPTSLLQRKACST
jgi:DNA-binding MarR family transcriptional regulator